MFIMEVSVHSLHSIVKLVGSGLNMEPQIVVFMHNINDMATLVRGGNYWSNINSRSILVDPSKVDVINTEQNNLLISLKR